LRGLRVEGVEGSGSRVEGSGFRVRGSGFRVQVSGWGVEGRGGGTMGPRCGASPDPSPPLSPPAFRFGVRRWVLGVQGFGCSGSEAGSYLRLIDFCITQL